MTIALGKSRAPAAAEGNLRAARSILMDTESALVALEIRALGFRNLRVLFENTKMKLEIILESGDSSCFYNYEIREVYL